MLLRFSILAKLFTSAWYARMNVWVYEWDFRDGTYSLILYFSLYPQNNKNNLGNQESDVLKLDFAAIFINVLYQ